MEATLNFEANVSRDANSEADRIAVERTLADSDAFDMLYRKYVADVFRYCYRRLEDREAAEDATSQIFMQAYSALPTLGSKPFRPWLFAIAHNAVIDLYRRRRPTAASLDVILDQIDPTASPEAHAIELESANTIRELFGQLSERDRQIVELRLAGLSGVEIAQALHCSSAVVRTAQHRAFGKIRVLLTQADQSDDCSRPKGTGQ